MNLQPLSSLGFQEGYPRTCITLKKHCRTVTGPLLFQTGTRHLGRFNQLFALQREQLPILHQGMERSEHCRCNLEPTIVYHFSGLKYFLRRHPITWLTYQHDPIASSKTWSLPLQSVPFFTTSINLNYNCAVIVVSLGLWGKSECSSIQLSLADILTLHHQSDPYPSWILLFLCAQQKSACFACPILRT